MKKFIGIPVSKGISIGRIAKYSKEKITGSVYQIEGSEVEREIQRYIKARDRANEYLSVVKEKARKELGSKELQIFDAHYYMLNDPVLDSEIRKIIRDKQLNAETAIRQAVDEVVDKFRRAGNSYIKERARDIEDVREHLLRALYGKTAPLRKLPEESIILAEDLNPSETAMLDKANLKGFILTQGGETAHSSIMAKSLMIPAVIQVKNIDREVKEGDPVILDALRGEVIVDPDNGLQDCYQKQIKEYQRRKQRLLRLRDKRAVTIDGFELDIAANINSAEEMGLVREVNGDGIGLFRTEFLFSGEEELRDEKRQVRIYREVLEEMNSAPVIIRTLDIGGDKELPYFTAQEEINPFLGWRGIRISLSTKDIFKCQLRALMRASVYGNLKILLPLISSMEELRKAQSLLNEVREELAKDNIPFDESVKVGIMVEVPAVAV
ncbi:MAG TPA: phosphoenolpyruvate--protein phosphotransferase, partial [Halanaerobiales bacterium]|nr:phosphoenolpyruvate--protein phosphotransferase [Halanaerobiales bacterium]